jgi:hypothetical protein
MAKKGLKEWLDEKWVDIGAPKKNGKFQPCGRSKGSKRKYPKCVPLAKATRMTSSQRASAVRRKRAASNTGPKPTNVATFAKRKKMSMGGLVWDDKIKCLPEIKKILDPLKLGLEWQEQVLLHIEEQTLVLN